jgi:hypothetical protein
MGKGWEGTMMSFQKRGWKSLTPLAGEKEEQIN